ncbi:hypothetical protein [Borreliella garinii]|uniref:hypothetical protein n=1 Tax=Borreliella garinii TaxID=29519 RepID=UPI00226CA316
MASEKLRIPSGAVLVTVNIDKFKWCFKGSDIKKNEEINGGDPKDLVVKDLASSITKPSKWKSIKECVFRVKKLDNKSKLASDFDLKEENIFYYHKDMCEDLSKCFGDTDEIDVLLFKTYCLGYSYTISSTKATETLKKQLVDQSRQLEKFQNKLLSLVDILLEKLLLTKKIF